MPYRYTAAADLNNGEPVYSDWTEVRRNLLQNPSFEVATTGWSSYGATTLARSTARAHAGVASLTVTSTAASTGGAQATGYAAVGGTTYTASAMALAVAGTAQTRARLSWYNGATFLSASEGNLVTLSSTVWTRISVTGVAPATATRVDVVLYTPAPTATTVRAFDAVILEASPVAGDYFDGNTNPSGDLERSRWMGTANASASVIETRTAELVVLPITEGRVNLDESWSPYASARVTVPFTGTTPIDDLDPREGKRVLITVTEDYNAVGGLTRTHDLAIRSRTIDHKARTIDLELASDEAFLFDKRRLGTTPDKGARVHEASVRGLCQWALDKIGATLEPNVWDADVTAAWAITNLVSNPSIEVNADGWTAGTNTTTVSRQAITFDPPSGWGLQWISAAAGTSYADYAASTGISVTPGQWYVLSGHMISSAASTGFARVHFKNDQGLTIKAVSGASVPVAGDSWTRPFVIVQAPPGATSVSIHFGYAASAAGRATYVDAVMFYEGDELVPYFDGSTSASARYLYSWSATVHGSTSARQPIVERRPETFSWMPGQTLWDFLRPFLEGAGLRLFCDDQRKWRLIDPTEYTPSVAAAIIAYAQPGNSNVTEATDTISLDSDEYATGVVVEFRWNDQSGASRTAYDSAGTDEKVLTFTRNTAPSPGAAASILSALAQSGNTQNISGLIQHDEAYPSNIAAVELPDTVRMLGYARSISIELTAGLVDVGTRDMQPAPI